MSELSDNVDRLRAVLIATIRAGKDHEIDLANFSDAVIEDYNEARREGQVPLGGEQARRDAMSYTERKFDELRGACWISNDESDIESARQDYDEAVREAHEASPGSFFAARQRDRMDARPVDAIIEQVRDVHRLVEAVRDLFDSDIKADGTHHEHSETPPMPTEPSRPSGQNPLEDLMHAIADPPPEVALPMSFEDIARLSSYEVTPEQYNELSGAGDGSFFGAGRYLSQIGKLGVDPLQNEVGIVRSVVDGGGWGRVVTMAPDRSELSCGDRASG